MSAALLLNNMQSVKTNTSFRINQVSRRISLKIYHFVAVASLQIDKLLLEECFVKTIRCFVFAGQHFELYETVKGLNVGDKYSWCL